MLSAEGVNESLSFPMQSRISNNNPISIAGLPENGGLAVIPKSLSPQPFETTPEEGKMSRESGTQADSKQFYELEKQQVITYQTL